MKRAQSESLQSPNMKRSHSSEPAQSESLQSPNMKKCNSAESHFINYVFDPPSLKSIALVTIAVKIYGCPDGRQYYESDGSWDNKIGRREIAMRKLEKIALPPSLKQQVSNIVETIHQQWREWIDYVDEKCFWQYCDLKKLYEKRGSSYWTLEGVVDAVKLLKDIFSEIKSTNKEDIDYDSLYETACMYCMEEYISEFWSKLPNRRKKFKCYRRDIVAYWTASLSNELPALLNEIVDQDINDIFDTNLSINVNMVFALILSNNLFAFKYFWYHMLTEEEKRFNIKDWIVLVLEVIQKARPKRCIEIFDQCSNDDQKFPQLFHSSKRFKLYCIPDDDFIFRPHYSRTYIMCFLLTNLDNYSEQREIFESYPKAILQSLFFHWPLKRYFLPTITVVLDFLNEDMYSGIMAKIGSLGIRQRVLFREVWDISPSHLKKSFINYLLDHAESIMLFIDDDITLNMIFKNATVEDRRQILFQVARETKFYKFIYREKTALSIIDRLALKTLSHNDFHSFKLDLISMYGKKLSSKWIHSRDFASLDRFLNWASPSLEECKKFKKKYIELEKLYTSLIIWEGYEHVNDYLKWYFEIEKEINEFKKSFVRKNNLIYCKSLIRNFSKYGIDGWEFFKNFLNFSFHSSEEIENAKNVFKEFVENDKCFAGKNDVFISLFKNWCLGSTLD